MEQEHSVTVRNPESKPTGRQVYALAHEFARRFDIDFPRTRGAASELIERLRKENATR
jgi:hypothetical protein